MEINEITGLITEAAVAVHRRLGPGLLESAYRLALSVEIGKRALPYAGELAIPLIYHGARLDCAYRLDFLVDGRVVVEVKAVRALDRVHLAQVLSYLRLGGHPVGLTINFNAPYLGDGAIRRLVNGYEGPRPRDSRRTPPSS